MVARAGAKYLLIYGVPPPSQYAFLLSALKAERAESFLVPEMRPELWGAHLIVAELLKRNAPTTVISDNMMGTLFAQGEIGKLCFFYDNLAAAGPQGICGSLLAVQLAHLHGVPIELFSGAGRKESTHDSDVTTFLGEPICPAGVAVRAVGSEAVPWGLFKN
jgi:methylthioribose-1-phosphate isomerase